MGPNLRPNLPLKRATGAVAKAGLDSDTTAPTAEFVRERLMELLNNIETITLQKKDAKRVRQIAWPDSGWERAKHAGKSAIPSGDAGKRGSRSCLLPYAASVSSWWKWAS